MALLSSVMDQSMMVLSRVTRSVVLASTNGLKDTLMSETSVVERWTVTVNLTTPQEKFLKEDSDKTFINTNLAT
jgi:hypothetical protein